jgi:hypothetical protein
MITSSAPAQEISSHDDYTVILALDIKLTPIYVVYENFERLCICELMCPQRALPHLEEVQCTAVPADQRYV